MKRRIAVAAVGLLLVIVVGLVAYKQFKGNVVSWYARNYHERTTRFVASDNPEQICLTWSDAPTTTQTIQWRTAPRVPDGWVQYRLTGQEEITGEIEAKPYPLEDPLLKNDPVNNRFTAVITGLKPATQYSYRVGSKQKNTWSDWADFTTAPDKAVPFSFIYLGDPQLGLDSWGKLVRKAYERYPNAAFYTIAGDIVNAGNFRNEWDVLFEGGKCVFDRRPVVPTLGNHDYAKLTIPKLYLESFGLPQKGPEGIPAEHAYTLRFSNALFLVLDSNIDPDTQVAWIEEQLKNTDATWKFALYHHPAYSSKKERDNPEVRKLWGDLFDKYHVDIALQGHDHAYLRTYPMKAGKRVESAKDGTYYIVSVSGTKYYDQDPHEYTEVGFTRISTYQVIDISTNPNRLTYVAYDYDGNVKDKFEIEK